MTKILRNAIRTPDGTVLESTYRWDYREYTDANGVTYMVDGGLDYFRRSAEGEYEDLSVTTEDDHDIIRQHFTWGSQLDADGLPLDTPVVRKLCELTDDHVKALVKWTADGYPDHIHQIMLDEAKWRCL